MGRTGAKTSTVWALAGVVLVLSACVVNGQQQQQQQQPAATQPNEKLIPEKDFEGALKQRARFENKDFSFAFPPPATAAPAGGELRPFTVDQAPILGVMPGNGVAQAFVTLQACGINQPHVHPRGTEVAHVIEGEVFFGLQEENTGRFVYANLTQGQSMLLPAGLLHFVQNLGCTPVKFLASFDHRDPGTLTVASSLFRFPDATLQATLGIPADEFRKVQEAAKAQQNPSQDPVCLARCKEYENPGQGKGDKYENYGNGRRL